MTLEQALSALEEAGTAQNRKVYERHGVTGAQYGVSFGALRAIAKKVGKDQDLAGSLWTTGNHDARLLAAMVAEAERVRVGELDRWSRDLSNYIQADTLSTFVARTSHARSRADRWIRARKEFVGQAGWNLVAHLALSDPEVEEAYFETRLAEIETGIGDAANRVRHAMNGALIAIGLRSPDLREAALAVAERVGRVDVDHGETSCETPEATAYIRKTWKAGKAERAFRGGKSRSRP